MGGEFAKQEGFGNAYSHADNLSQTREKAWALPRLWASLQGFGGADGGREGWGWVGKSTFLEPGDP